MSCFTTSDQPCVSQILSVVNLWRNDKASCGAIGNRAIMTSKPRVGAKGTLHSSLCFDIPPPPATPTTLPPPTGRLIRRVCLSVCLPSRCLDIEVLISFCPQFFAHYYFISTLQALSGPPRRTPPVNRFALSPTSSTSMLIAVLPCRA
ncbi:hypothetical protein J6590_037916 [Homalodisca vitripennis]|nr:hypothetical protein J6590_037916 [Homalodisca vitripennis]